MFKNRSQQKELMDDLSLDHTALNKNLTELEVTNRWLGSQKALLSSLEKVYKKHKALFSHREIIVADLGCGGGDLLRAVSSWAGRKQVNVRLIGIDANAFMIKNAMNKSKSFPNIHYQKINIHSLEFAKLRFDIATLNSFCHHLNNEELLELIKKLLSQSQLAIIINDLHRHWLPYFFILIISKLFNFSHLAQHDGPLSILRAFNKIELRKLAQNASLKNYTLTWKWPFRWQMIIWC